MGDELADRLLDVLRGATGIRSLGYAPSPQPLTGGFWAELLAFRLVDGPDGWDHDLVARVMPDPDLARKETVVQTEVARLGFPTPTVRAAGGPDDGLGRAFMVMDRAAGVPLLAGLDGGEALARLPLLAARIPEMLAMTMAGLHRIDPRSVQDGLRHCPGVVTTVAELLEGLRSSSTDRGRPDLADAARRLMGDPPPPEPEVICHGDLHPFNLLVDAAGSVTVLDWSAALLGQRAYDVAFTSVVLANPPIPVPAPLRPVVRAVGRSLSRRFRRRYRRHSGVAVQERTLRWHQAVVCLRALAEVAGWGRRRARAQKGTSVADVQARLRVAAGRAHRCGGARREAGSRVVIGPHDRRSRCVLLHEEPAIDDQAGVVVDDQEELGPHRRIDPGPGDPRADQHVGDPPVVGGFGLVAAEHLRLGIKSFAVQAARRSWDQTVRGLEKEHHPPVGQDQLPQRELREQACLHMNDGDDVAVG